MHKEKRGSLTGYKGVPTTAIQQFWHIPAACGSAVHSDQGLPKMTCQRLSRKQAHGSNTGNVLPAKSNEHLWMGIYVGSPGRVKSIPGFGREEERQRMPEERCWKGRLWANIALGLSCVNEPGSENVWRTSGTCSKQRPLVETERTFSLDFKGDSQRSWNWKAQRTIILGLWQGRTPKGRNEGQRADRQEGGAQRGANGQKEKRSRQTDRHRKRLRISASNNPKFNGRTPHGPRCHSLNRWQSSPRLAQHLERRRENSAPPHILAGAPMFSAYELKQITWPSHLCF